MNRITLVLNAAILVVTFVVALTAGTVQGDLLASTSRAAGRGTTRQASPSNQSLAVIRVVQAMESYYPATQKNELTRNQLSSIQEAVSAYERGMESALQELIAGSEGAGNLRSGVSTLGKGVRIEVESVLAESFSDPAVVRRLATEVIRNCR